LSRIAAEPKRGVQAIYAGPLKALINDQFLRLERLCEIAEIPVHKWHGDVGQAAKKKLLERPSGVLLITPESIESLFINHPQRLASVFAGLEYVVIDEMHAFLGSERGAHLKSLITRLAAKSKLPVRRIGLSATLGDMASAQRWLRHDAPDAVRLIEDKSDEKTVRLKLYGYLLAPARKSKPAAPGGDDPEVPIDQPLALDVFNAFKGRTALIFANRKSDIEAYADFARHACEASGLPDQFRVHHGSLSKGEREDTEEALRSGRPTATFCSSTLEMGIDVGSVQAVGQIGSPWSVAAMAQRLGRSGRKEGDAQELRIYIEEDEPEAQTTLPAQLFPDLLQAIAMTELMVREQWCEPPDVDRLHLSTLVQQVLSVIAEAGGARADRLYALLIERGAFSVVDRPIFVQTLRDMGKADLIEQTPEGLLILGLKGEQIVRHHDFYMAFQVKEEYRVTCQARHIGNVELPPLLQENPFIILAGRRWKVLDVDDERHVILVEPSPGGRRPGYLPASGGEIHSRVRQTMRSLLFREDIPSYLDPRATDMLARARQTARDAGLGRQPFMQDGSDVLWFTWTGTRIHRTLTVIGMHLGGFKVEDERGIALTFEKATTASVVECYRRALATRLDPQTLAKQFACRFSEKYEPCLSEELQCRVFGRDHLDLRGTIELLGSISAFTT
jgi:ATP-dependent Lhr-like helicase